MTPPAKKKRKKVWVGYIGNKTSINRVFKPMDLWGKNILVWYNNFYLERHPEYASPQTKKIRITVEEL